MSRPLTFSQRIPMSACTSPAHSARNQSDDFSRKLSTALGELERVKAERDAFADEASTLKMECSRLQRALEANPSRRHRSQPLESTELLSAQLLDCDLDREKLARLNGALSQRVETLELERKELLSKLAAHIQEREQTAQLHSSEMQHAAGVHLRHSRLLASIVVASQLSALVSRARGKGLSTLRQWHWHAQQQRHGLVGLIFAMRKFEAAKASRRLHQWRELTTRGMEEAEKSTLLQGFHMTMDKQVAGARLQILSCRVAAARQLATARHRVQEGVDSLLERGAKVRRLAAFLAWKAHYLTSFSANLRSEAAALHAKAATLGESLTREQAEHQRTLMEKAVTCMVRQSRVQMWNSFDHWHRSVAAFKAKTPVLKRVLTNWSRSKEVMALSTWKAAVAKMRLGEAADKSRKLTEEVRVLREHVWNLEKVLELEGEYRQMTRLKRLRASVKAQLRLQLRTGLRQWGSLARRSLCKRKACQSIVHSLRLANLAAGWQRLQFTQRRKVAKEQRLKQLFKLALLGDSTRKRMVFGEWTSFTRVRKFARKLVRKAMNHSALDDLRKGLLTWKDRMHSLRHEAVSNSLARISDEKTAVEQHLQEASTELARLRVSMRVNGVRRMGATALRRGLLVQAVVLWRAAAERHKLRSSTSTRLLVLWHKQHLRRGLRTWVSAMKVGAESELKAQMKSLQRDLKEQRRLLKSQKDSFEQSASEKDDELQATNRTLEKTQREFEYVLCCLQRTKQSSVSKAKLCMMVWRTHTSTVRRSCQRLLTALQRGLKRTSLTRVRAFGLRRQERAWLERCLQRFAGGFARCGLRTFTQRWRFFVRQLRESELHEAAQLCANETQVADHISTAIKDRLSVRLMQTSARQVQLRALFGWKKAAVRQRIMRTASEQFRQSSEERGMLRALRTLHLHARSHKNLVRKFGKLMAFFAQKSKTAVFSAWAQQRICAHRLAKSLTVPSRRQQTALIRVAFERIAAHSLGVTQQHLWTDRLRKRLVAKSAVWLGQRRLSIGFTRWKETARRTKLVEKCLKRMMTQPRIRALQASWTTWIHSAASLRTRVLEALNSAAAKRARALQQKLNAVASFLAAEGLSLRQRFVLERETSASAVVSAEGKEITAPLPRCFTLWRLVMAKSQRLRRVATRLRAYRRTPGLLWGFLGWKRQLTAVRFKRYTKRELTAVVWALERDLGGCESDRRALLHDAGQTAQYCRFLESLVRRGQAQALNALGLLVRTRLLKAFSRWAHKTAGQEVQALRLDVEDLEQELRAATASLVQLKTERVSLLEEVEDLQRTAREEQDIAALLGSLQDENRDFRLQLRERAEVIQRLLIENKELAAKGRDRFALSLH